MAKLTVAKGKTRGKNPRDIEYNEFNREFPENLPKTLVEFSEITGVKEEAGIVDLLIDGYNEQQYKAASDEIGEFVNDEWRPEFAAQFRLAVRAYAKTSGDSIEDVVALLKPGMERNYPKWLAKFNEDKAKAASEKKETVAA